MGSAPTVTEVEPPSRSFTKGLMLFAAASHAVMAYLAAGLDDLPVHWVSVGLFLAAAGGSVHVAWRVENLHVVALAGALAITAYASRAALVAFGWLWGTLELDDGRVWLTMIAWLVLTVYAYAIYVRGVAPLSRMYRVERIVEAEGDG